MTNLTEKFTTLETTLGAQHTALLGRLDSIITKLDALNATATAGSFNATPVVAAIEALGGKTGTLPGSTLLQLYNEMVALRGTGGPETTIRSINQSLWALAGAAPGKSLADIYNMLNPVFGATPLNIFDNIYIALTDNGATEAAANAILVRLIEQFDSGFVYPTMKDLLISVNNQAKALVTNTQNPLKNGPDGCCATPLTSTGGFYVETTAVFITPVTNATWPQTPGGDFTADYDLVHQNYLKIHCTDWSKYRIYVASKADSFGVVMGHGERFATNTWLTLSIPEGPAFAGASFNVDRANDLKVYICPVSDSPVQAVLPPPCA
jgi:hypothetical protein